MHKTFVSMRWSRAMQTLMMETLMMETAFLACLVIGTPVEAQVTPDTEGWFAFTVPGLDASKTHTDLSWLNSEPAGSHGHLRAEGGHFVDGRGRRVRLFGTNLTATSCFPEKDIARLLAAHFRKLGFNVVRFHFMDVRESPTGIFAGDRKSLDPAQLDKLDYFIAQLKHNGIYVNLNLHVAYPYDIDRSVIRRNRTFRMGKVLDTFYPPFLEFRKAYARALLTHRNPHTGLTYAEDPAVAAVELNNENTLLRASWKDLREMPDPYGKELRRQWNAYLKKHYGTTDRLRQAWSKGEEPLGPELLGPGRWVAQAFGDAEATLETGVTFDRQRKGLRYHAVKPGTETWHMQFYQRGLELHDGAAYTLSFQARSPQPRRLSVHAMLDVSPWTMCGPSQNVELTPEFGRFDFTFRASHTQPGQVRINFSTHNKTGTFELANISLRRGGITGLPDGQSLSRGNVAIPSGKHTDVAQRDLLRFLIHTERNGVREIVQFLKNDLHVLAPVSNTQASYGGEAGVHREATLCDYVDMHGYWQHPRFLRKPWDAGDWRIGNSSQVAAADGGTLARIAAHRVYGLPFTVSEYNIPAPNDHAAELFPLLATIAAYQDWDGVYQYTYSNFTPDWTSNRIKSYFDLCGHTGQLANAPLGSLIFRLGLVKPAQQTATVELGSDVDTIEPEGLQERWTRIGVPGGAVSMRKLGIRLTGNPADSKAAFQVPDGRRVSDTGQIRWDPTTATFTVNAPAARVAVGPIKDATLGDLQIRSDGRYVCIGVVALDTKPLAESRRVLISVVARVENQSMGWDSDRRTVGRNWGHGPTVCEAVTASITLPGTDWKAQRLDGTGAAIGPARGRPGGDRFTLNVSPEDRTLWFLLAR